MLAKNLRSKKPSRDWALLILICASAFSSQAQQMTVHDTNGSGSLDTITSGALLHAHTYSYLKELSDGIGPRLTASSEAARACQWALKKMESIGLKNVHLEKWQLARGWQRDFARAELISPMHLPLNITSYGWVGSTTRGGIEAQVVLVNGDSLAEEIQKNASSWAGKVLFLAPNDPKHTNLLRSFAQLGPFVSAANAAHAVAVIARDTRPGTMLTHTGPVAFGDAFYAIPVVDIAPEHQKLIGRLLSAGTPVRIKIDVQNNISPGPVESANVVGEITGYEHPEQLIILGAHLDSWDLGTGAIDDGFGVASVLGAAEALLASRAKPRRTIRFVLFTGEEQGLLGSRAYLRDHRAETPNIVCALVLDWGQGPITGIPLAGHDELSPAFQQLSGFLNGLGTIKVVKGYLSFTDAYSFTLVGVPGIGLLQESHDYTLLGHSAADTLDKVEPDVLSRNTAVLAVSGFWIADHPNRLGIVWPSEKTAQVLTDDEQRSQLEMLGLWPPSL